MKLLNQNLEDRLREKEKERLRHLDQAQPAATDMDSVEQESERRRLLSKCAAAHNEIEKLMSQNYEYKKESMKLKRERIDASQGLGPSMEVSQSMEREMAKREEDLKEKHIHDMNELRRELSTAPQASAALEKQEMGKLSDSIHKEARLRFGHAEEVSELKEQISQLKTQKKASDIKRAKGESESMEQMQRLIKQQTAVRGLWETDLQRMKNEMVN